MVRGGAGSPELYPDRGYNCPTRVETRPFAAVSSKGQGQLSQDQPRAGLAQHSPLISSRMVPMTPEVTQVTDINTDQSCSRTTDMALGSSFAMGDILVLAGSTGHSDKNGSSSSMVSQTPTEP